MKETTSVMISCENNKLVLSSDKLTPEEGNSILKEIKDLPWIKNLKANEVIFTEISTNFTLELKTQELIQYLKNNKLEQISTIPQGLSIIASISQENIQNATPHIFFFCKTAICLALVATTMGIALKTGIIDVSVHTQPIANAFNTVFPQASINNSVTYLNNFYSESIVLQGAATILQHGHDALQYCYNTLNGMYSALPFSFSNGELSINIAAIASSLFDVTLRIVEIVGNTTSSVIRNMQ